jgi:serine/threonine protein kinase
MAPEQAEGRLGDVGPATDVYALGVILYELLTGRTPFHGQSEPDTLRRIVSEEPIPMRRVQPGVPRDLEAVCLKCLEKPTARRYVSAAALAGDLRNFLNGKSTVARPLPALKRTVKWTRRHPALAASVLLGVLALAAVIAGLVRHTIQQDLHSARIRTGCLQRDANNNYV